MGGLLAAPRGAFSVEVTVQAPSWIDTTTLQLLVNGKPRTTIALKGKEVLRHQGVHRIKCKQDCFVVAVVRGEPIRITTGAVFGSGPGVAA